MELLFNLWCDQTSESGEDEIYIKIKRRWSKGTTGEEHIPYVPKNVSYPYNPWGPFASAPGEWYFNEDDDKKQNVNNISLANFSLNSGESMEVEVEIWEHDTPSTFTIFIEIPIPDAHDLIGSFAVTITNDGGVINTLWRAGQNVSEQIPEDRTGGGPGSYGFRFTGDGSNYYGWGIVRS